MQQNRPGADAWAYAAFIQVRIAETAIQLRDSGQLGNCEVAMTKLGKLCQLGPAEMQIKNANQGLFDIVETMDPTVYGEPALWHHSSRAIRTLETSANPPRWTHCRYERRDGLDDDYSHTTPSASASRMKRYAGCERATGAIPCRRASLQVMLPFRLSS